MARTPKTAPVSPRPPVRRQTVLVLQGGGALGAYQVGVYQALHEAGLEPDWVIGTSIGAINGALIAGNRPEDRLARLDAFWQQVEQGVPPLLPLPWPGLDHWLAGARAVAGGIPGFFAPHPSALRGPLAPVGVEQAAWYTTTPLHDTLTQLVDFGQVHGGPIRLTVGAVNAASGRLRYFDSHTETLGVPHIMASGALPPAFPAIRIDGQPYWDGGICSNTPIEAVFDQPERRSSLIFSVNVWQPAGPEPDSLVQVLSRQKDIQYASRDESHIARQQQLHRLRRVIRELKQLVPADRLADPAVQRLLGHGCGTTMQVVRLQAPRLDGEDLAKDIDFSRSGIRHRRQAGYDDTRRMLTAAPWNEPMDPMDAVVVYQDAARA